MTLSPSDLGWIEIKVGAILFALTTIAVWLRFITRRLFNAAFGLDDLFTGISWLTLLALAIQLFLWASIGGNGHHIKDLDPEQMELFLKIFYINQVTYFVCAPCIKLSIVFFYRRIFCVPKFVLAADMFAIVIGAWGLAIILAGVFQCTPIDSFWGPPGSGTCVDERAFLYGVQGPNIIFDWALLFMPVPVIWSIQRPLKDKLAIVAVFTLGGIGCVSGIFRIVALGAIDPEDETYSIFLPTTWTIVEPCLALICASLPVIRGLMNQRRRAASVSTSKAAASRQMSYARSNRISKALPPDPPLLLSDAATTTTDGGNSTEMRPYRVMVSKEISVVSEPIADWDARREADGGGGGGETSHRTSIHSSVAYAI